MNTMDQLPFNQRTDSVGIIDAGECGDEHRGGKEKENNRRGRKDERDRRDQLSLLNLTRPRNGDELIVFVCCSSRPM